MALVYKTAAAAVAFAPFGAAAGAPARAQQPRSEIRGGQNPVDAGGRDATIIYGYAPLQLRRMIELTAGPRRRPADHLAHPDGGSRDGSCRRRSLTLHESLAWCSAPSKPG